MPSAAGGVFDRSVGHSAFCILPTVPQPTSADFIPQITFRISANYQHPRIMPFKDAAPLSPPCSWDSLHPVAWNFVTKY